MSASKEDAKKLLRRTKTKATRAMGEYFLALELYEVQYGDKQFAKNIKEKKTDPLKLKRAANKKKNTPKKEKTVKPIKKNQLQEVVVEVESSVSSS